MKTAQEYFDSLRKRNIKVFLKGQRLEPDEVIDHPFIKGHVASAGLTFQLAHEPETEDLMTATSHLTGKKIKPIHPYSPKCRRFDKKSQNAADDFAEDGNLLSTLRRV